MRRWVVRAARWVRVRRKLVAELRARDEDFRQAMAVAEALADENRVLRRVLVQLRDLDGMLRVAPKTPMTVEEAEEEIGRLSVLALDTGGESLLDDVQAALGVAHRHVDRVRSGRLSMVPGVVAEIESSFRRAKRVVENAKAGGRNGPASR